MQHCLILLGSNNGIFVGKVNLSVTSSLDCTLTPIKQARPRHAKWPKSWGFLTTIGLYRAQTMCFQQAGMAWAEQGGGEHTERPMNSLYANLTPGFIYVCSCTVTHITKTSTRPQNHVLSPCTVQLKLNMLAKNQRCPYHQPLTVVHFTKIHNCNPEIQATSTLIFWIHLFLYILSFLPH